MMNQTTKRLAARLGCLLLFGGLAAPHVAAQETEIISSGISVASGYGNEATIQFELSDGSRHEIAFEDGLIRVDGDEIGRYEPGGALETSWREFLSDQASLDARGVKETLLRWIEAILDELRGDATSALATRVSGIFVAEPAAPAPVAPATLTGPEGQQLSIAPGGIPFDALSAELERLQETLAPLAGISEAAAGELALIVHDDYAIAAGQTIAGDLALVDGTLEVAGTVDGDVLILEGALIIEPGATITGDVLADRNRATIEVKPGGRIEGELLSDTRLLEVVREAPPETPVAAERPARGRTTARAERRPGFFDRLGSNFRSAFGGLASTLGMFLCLAVIGLIAVYFGSSQLDTVATTVRQQFGRSFAMGIAGQILFFPILLLLIVFIITLPVVPFFAIAFALACVMGYLAVAHGAGEMFADRRYGYEWLERLRRSNSYYYVISGLVLLLIPFAFCSALGVFGGLLGFLQGLIGFAAVVGTWILGSAGLGAVLLTRAGTRPVYREASDDWMTATATDYSAAPMDMDVDVEIEEPEAPETGGEKPETGGEEGA